ncbi:MAG: hypothetical protein HC788_08540 [Sphingopyxis sp.]|nr:hypothetical protein [Sphingopyxis sp.]
MVLTTPEVVALLGAGICGCLATAFTLQAISGRSAWVVAGNWRKHVWSIIFASPLILLDNIPVPGVGGIMLSLLWLGLAPTLASKLYFGPKDAPWQRLFTLHFAYAFAALAVFLIIQNGMLQLLA